MAALLVLTHRRLSVNRFAQTLWAILPRPRAYPLYPAAGSSRNSLPLPSAPSIST